MKHVKKYRNKQQNTYVTYFTETNLALKKPAYQSSTWNGHVAERWDFFNFSILQFRYTVFVCIFWLFLIGLLMEEHQLTFLIMPAPIPKTLIHRGYLLI